MLRIEELKDQGNQFFQKGHYENALQKYNEILEIKKDYQPALLNKAMAYKRLGRFNDALSVLEELLKLNPQHSKGLYQKASILQEQGNCEEAGIFYTASLSIDSKPIETKTGLFECKQQTDAKVIFAVADLKLTKDNRVKILEFGNYIKSSCSGYEDLTGKKVLDHFSAIGLPPLILALDCNQAKFDYSNYDHFKCLNLQPKTTPYSDQDISSHSAIYAGWAVNQLKKDVMILGDTTIDIILGHKALTHDCFEKADLLGLRPNTFRILRNDKVDAQELAKKIKDQMPDADRFILKSPELSEGDGVMVVNRKDLEDILNMLLSPPSNERMKLEMSFFVAKQVFEKGSTKHYSEKNLITLERMRQSRPTYYLVEEYIHNKPIQYKNENYDATMRFVFAFVKDKINGAKIFPLAYYWKLPPKPINAEAVLRETTISSYTENHSLAAAVSENDASIVFENLKNNLPILFSCMLKQRILNMAKEDAEKNEDSHLWQLVSRYATDHGCFDVAKHAFGQYFKMLKAPSNPQRFAEYYLFLGHHHFISGNYDEVIKNLSMSIKYFPQCKKTYAEAYFIRGISYCYSNNLTQEIKEKIVGDFAQAEKMDNKYGAMADSVIDYFESLAKQEYEAEMKSLPENTDEQIDDEELKLSIKRF